MDPLLPQVFEAARAGSVPAFRALVELLAPDLLRFAAYLLHGDRDAARDAVQEVFVRAWKALPRLNDAEHVQRWAYRVARCHVAGLMRRHGKRWRRLRQLPAEGDGVGFTSSTPHEPSDLVRERPPVLLALDAALVRMPKAYGAPLHLHYMQGFDISETAHLLGLTVPATKMRLVRGRERLRRELAPFAVATHGARRNTAAARKRGTHDT